MLLYDVRKLSEQDLRKLYTDETTKLLQGINENAPFNHLQEIRKNLKSISEELESRHQ